MKIIDMASNSEMTIEQEVAQIRMKKPHVVVLGAGASRANCPNGDKNSKKLPLMRDFTDVLDIKSMLQEWEIDPEQNFEEIFSDLHEKGEKEKLEKIEQAVEDYFNELELPEKPTMYDHLILSLREKDLIATFNWDPLLTQAYLRNSKVGLKLPRMAFLHGNVGVGYCEKDKVTGRIEMKCRKCGEDFKRSPLLYPIREKDYAKNPFIRNEWGVLRGGFQNAFMITIFGYSGPKTDTEAISAMQNSWGNVEDRPIEQTNFITTRSEEDILANWKDLIHTHHYTIDNNFYDSWIAKHPRRTGEAYLNQYFDVKFIEDNPIPRDLDLPELWKWFLQFKKAEDDAGV